jgi:hypothetical protein
MAIAATIGTLTLTLIPEPACRTIFPPSQPTSYLLT